MAGVLSGLWSLIQQHLTLVGVPFGVTASLVTIGRAVWYRLPGRHILAYRLTHLEALSPNARTRWVEAMAANPPPSSISYRKLRIWYRGPQAIKRDDFDNNMPILMRFGRGRVAFHDISRVKPKDLDPKIMEQDDGLAIQPLLLNSHDSIEVELLLTDFDGAVSATCRIAGIRSMTKDPGRVVRIGGLITLVIGVITLGSVATAIVVSNTNSVSQLTQFFLQEGTLQTVVVVFSILALVNLGVRFSVSLSRALIFRFLINWLRTGQKEKEETSEVPVATPTEATK